MPDLEGLDDDRAVDFLQQVYYPKVDRAVIAGKLGIKPAAPQGPERSALRAVGDVGLSAVRGVGTGVRMLTDLAGADNAASGGLRTVDDYLRGLQSAKANADEQEVSRLMAEAEGKGILDQVIAAGKAFAVAPVSMTANALGTSVPTLAASLVPGLGGAAIAGRIAGAGMGAAQGVGAVKGGIYETVKQELLKAGASLQEAEQRAVAAQEYAGSNAGQMALGGVGGVLAGSTGAERILAGMRRPVAGEVPGVLRRALGGAVTEAVPEAMQGGQEKYAANSALINEGFDRSPWQGVAGGAALEGMASAGMGAGFGAMRPAAPAPETPGDALRQEKLPETGPATRALNAGVEAVAQDVDAKLTRRQETAPIAAALALMTPEARQEALQNLAVADNMQIAGSVRRRAQNRLDVLMGQVAPPAPLDFTLAEAPGFDPGLADAPAAMDGLDYEANINTDGLELAPPPGPLLLENNPTPSGRLIADEAGAVRPEAMTEVAARREADARELALGISPRSRREKKRKETPDEQPGIAPPAAVVDGGDGGRSAEPAGSAGDVGSVAADAGGRTAVADPGGIAPRGEPAATVGSASEPDAALTEIVELVSQFDAKGGTGPSFARVLRGYAEDIRAGKIKPGEVEALLPKYREMAARPDIKPAPAEAAQPSQEEDASEPVPPAVGDKFTIDGKRYTMDKVGKAYYTLKGEDGKPRVVSHESKVWQSAVPEQTAPPAPDSPRTRRDTKNAEQPAAAEQPTQIQGEASSEGAGGSRPTPAPVAAPEQSRGPQAAISITPQALWDITLPKDREPVLLRAGWMDKSPGTQAMMNKPWADLSHGQKKRITKAMEAEAAPEQQGPRSMGGFTAGDVVDVGASNETQQAQQARQEDAQPSEEAAKPAVLTPPAKRAKAAQARADARRAQIDRYFTPGNIVKSYGGGHDEVLALKHADDGGFSVQVHPVTKSQGSGQWVRLGKPQDARRHSTFPEARELTAGPVAGPLFYTPGDLVSYTEGRADGQPFKNAPDRGAKTLPEAAPAAPAPTPDKAESKPAPTPSANTIFTEDAAAAARALLKRKLGGLNSGIDPEVMQAGITLAGYHIEKGARTFTAYAQAMLADLGDAVKPYLKSWFMGVKYDPRAAAWKDMDGAATVEAFDVDALRADAAPADALTMPPAQLDALAGQTVAIEVQVGDTGQTATMTMDAGDAVRDVRTRLAAAEQLRKCLS